MPAMFYALLCSRHNNVLKQEHNTKSKIEFYLQKIKLHFVVSFPDAYDENKSNILKDLSPVHSACQVAAI